MSNDLHTKKEIRVGVIGFGFMGRTHTKAYQCAQHDGFPCKVVAIADSGIQSLDQPKDSVGNIASADSEIDTSQITLLRDAQELIDRPDIDLISICTHTDTHVDLAIQALNAAKHVLVEKPIAINPADVHKLTVVANESGRICIPAMCMRFWPAWLKMRELIHSKQFGTVRSAVFHRLGSRPTWAAEFYADESRSGGVLHDLHIHDTDFIVHCFGVPQAVTTVGDGLHLSTHFHFADGPVHVFAHAAWDHQPAAGFEMRCTIACQHATIDFDINRDNQLIIHKADTSTPIDVGNLSGYDGEIRYMIDLISGKTDTNTTSMNDAAMVADVLEAQSQSISTGLKVSL